MRLIDADALINKLDEMISNAILADTEIHYALIRELVAEQPTIEPKCAEWVETEPDEDDRKIGIEFSIKCSRCHDENSHLSFNENHEITGKTFWKSRFCPNCGAHMRKKGDDND